MVVTLIDCDSFFVLIEARFNFFCDYNADAEQNKRCLNCAPTHLKSQYFSHPFDGFPCAGKILWLL